MSVLFQSSCTLNYFTFCQNETFIQIVEEEELGSKVSAVWLFLCLSNHHISVPDSWFCIFTSYCCTRWQRKWCHSQCRSVVGLWPRRAVGCLQRPRSLPVDQRRRHGSIRLAAQSQKHLSPVTSWTFNMKVISTSELRLYFQFAL